MIKRIILSLLLPIVFLNVYAQENVGSPYSIYGIGLLPANNSPYTAMGGVSAAMRDYKNINFLNPASYTALDSNRFYFQLGITGEYAHISTHKKSADYRVAQNANLSMALRLYRNLYFSFGFTEKSDIGYDLFYSYSISGSVSGKFNQNISGEGGLNDIYAGFGWKYKNFAIGTNFSYVFGKIEKRQTLTAEIENSFYIRTSENNRIRDFLFTPGVQYQFKLSPKSLLALGTSMNFTQKLTAKKEFISYKVNSSSGNSTTLDDEILRRGYIKYPFRIISGFNYQFKNKWQAAADYTFHKMSVYEEFKINQQLKDYHKVNAGISWTPEEYGRFWWQRNRYMLGGYFIKSEIQLKETNVDTYGVTFGTQIPFISQRAGELLLGIAFDLGIRGTEKNGLIQEKYAKLRVNSAFKELWFMKRKIN